MYIIIAGITTLGRKLVERLEERHDIVAIDEDEDKCERLYSSSGATVINKAPSTLTALEDAGITKADVMISALDNDNQNMVVCSLAKKYGVSKVISKVEDDEYLEAFDIIGAEAIAHTDLLISEFLSSIEHPNLVKLANISEAREMLKATIREDTSLVGATPNEILSDKNFPDKFKIVSVIGHEKVESKDLDIELREGESIILIGDSDQKNQLDKYFRSHQK